MTEQEYAKEIGLRIAAARADRGLTQAELAVRVGISKSAIGMYEQGRRTPGISEAVAMAEALGQDPSYLLCLADEPKPSAAPWIDQEISDLPDMFKEALRLRIRRYVEMAEKLPVSTFIILSAPTSQNYEKWERAVESHYRRLTGFQTDERDEESTASAEEIANINSKIASGEFSDIDPGSLRALLDAYAGGAPEQKELLLKSLGAASSVNNRKQVGPTNKPKP